MKLRVALVDDSTDTLEVLSLLYSQRDDVLLVGTAKTLEEAQELVGETEVDVLSLDIRIGNRNGIDLCRAVHRDFPHVYISMCSLESDDVMMRIAEEAGASYFMAKPVLLQDIDLMLGHCHSLREA